MPAKIIGTAGIRLTADEKGLAAEIRGILQTSLRQATTGLRSDATSPLRDDADRTGAHVRKVLGDLGGIARKAATGIASAGAAGLKLTLIGTAAGAALAGISSLTVGVVGLVGVLGQAAGVAGLLPAAFVAVKAATATVKIGLTGIAEAFKVVGEDSAQFEEAIKDLAPAAQDFMRQVRALQPALDGLRLDVQQRLFSGMGQALNDLSSRYLPIANSLFGSIATSINGAGKELTSFLKSGEVVGQVDNLAGNLKTTFQNLAPALTPAVSGLLDFTEVGSRFLPQIGTEIQGLAVRFQEFMRNAAASGQLETFFANAIQAAKDLFAALRDFGAGLKGIFDAASLAGGGFLVNLRSMAAAFREFTTSAEGQEKLLKFFTEMKTITSSLMPVFGALANVIISDLAPILADLAATIGPALEPVVAALGDALRAAAPGIQALATGVAAFLTAAAPLLPVLGQIAGVIAGALGKAFEALAPVIAEVADVLADSLAEILPVIEPIIGDVAKAFADLVKALIPLIPVFFQVLAAVLPILPPLLQLIAGILPPLISLVQALTPLITAIATVFAAVIPIITAVATTILNLLIPPLNLIITVVGQVASIVATGFQTIATVISTVLQAISSLIGAVWGGIFNTISSIVTSIGGFIRGAFEGIRNFFVNIMSGIRDSVSNGVKNVIQFFKDLPGNILSALGDLGGLLLQAGIDLIQGFINGIGDMIGNAIDAVGDLVGGVVDTITSGFGIFSPSRVMRDLAHQVGAGFVLGIEDSQSEVVAATEAMTNAAIAAADGTTIAPSFDLPVPGGTQSAPGTAAGALGGVTLYQTNVMRAGADVEQFASTVYRNGARALSSASSNIATTPQSPQRGISSDNFVTAGT